MRDEKTELHTKPFLTLLYILHLENLGLGLLVRRHDYQMVVRQELAGIKKKTYNFAENGIVMPRGTQWALATDAHIPLLRLAPSPNVES